MTRNTLKLGLVMLLTACDGGGPDSDAMIMGRVTNNDGAQARLAGAGTAEAAATVEAYAIEGDGSLTVVAEADVEADGSFSVPAPEPGTWAVVRALGDDGEIVGSVVVEPATDAERVATPIDSESSLEAEVFLQADADVATWARVRSTVDARTAISVRESDELETEISALADAVQAAARTEAEIWADQGLDHASWIDAQVAATAALTSDLHAGDADAYAKWYVALDGAAMDAGADVHAQAEGEAAASLAFRVALDAQGAGDLLDATASSTSHAEARLWTSAFDQRLEAAGATDAHLSLAQDAHVALLSDLASASSASAAADANAAWRAQLVGAQGTDASVLVDVLGGDVVTTALLGTALDLAADTATALDAAVLASAQAAVDGSTVDVDAIATATAQAYVTEQAALRSSLEVALEGVANAGAAADVFVSANAFMRAL